MDARRQALNYAFAVKAGLGVEMSVGKRMLTVFERRPGVLHAAITGFRPAWKAFARITRGSTTLGEIVRTYPMAGRVLSRLGPAAAAASSAAPSVDDDPEATSRP